MQTTISSQHAPDFAEGSSLLVPSEVVKHERGQHSIERAVWIVQRIRESAIELDARVCASGFSRRSSERPVIWIHSNNVDAWVRRLRQHDQASGSAADVEYAMARMEFGLAQKLPSCVVEPEQPGDRIVERQ